MQIRHFYVEKQLHLPAQAQYVFFFLSFKKLKSLIQELLNRIRGSNSEKAYNTAITYSGVITSLSRFAATRA